MKFKIKSVVFVDSIGNVKHEHIQEFPNDSNVFGRALSYREYMYKKFPGSPFKLLEAKLLD